MNTTFQLFAAMLLVATTLASCQSKSQKQECQDNDESTDEYYADVEMWRYDVVLIEDKAENPADDYKHVGGMKLAALTLMIGDNFAEYKDEDDYAEYARRFYLARELALEFEMDCETYPSSQQWADFNENVLNACRFDPPLFNEIKNKQWRERAKKIWYDRIDNQPVYYKDKAYRRQSFKIGDNDFWGTIYINGADETNRLNVPEGSFLIK